LATLGSTAFVSPTSLPEPSSALRRPRSWSTSYKTWDISSAGQSQPMGGRSWSSLLRADAVLSMPPATELQRSNSTGPKSLAGGNSARPGEHCRFFSEALRTATWM